MRTRYRLTGLLGSAAAIVLLLSGTALAQMRPGVNFMTDKPPPSKEEQERLKAVDDAYKNAMQKVPDKKKSADPWEGVRSAPARQGKQ